MQKNVTRPLFYATHTQINTKWTKDLNARPETINLLDENMTSNLADIILSEVSVAMTPKARETETKINKWYHIKLKSFLCTLKKTTVKIKRLLTK